MPDHHNRELFAAKMFDLIRRPSWWADAAHPAYYVFPRDEAGANARRAKRICNRCLVLEECRDGRSRRSPERGLRSEIALYELAQMSGVVHTTVSFRAD